VKSIGYQDGKPHWESDLKTVKKEDSAASLFEIPEGYAERKMERPEKAE